MVKNIVRENLMDSAFYSPYCGDYNCRAGMPRTKWNGSQFECSCGFVTEFPANFIRKYKQKWSK